MRLLLASAPHISIGSTGIGIFGFVEVRWAGRQVMVGGHPIDSFFVEAACLFMILFGVSMGWFLVMRYLEIVKVRTIADLEEIQECGEELVNWASVQPIDMQAMPRSQRTMRHLILSKKYKRWLKEPAQHPSVADFVRSAAECAETLRAYGYVRGRFLIWRSNREWKDVVQQSKSQQPTREQE